MRIYYPILLSKAGELAALSKLDQNVKNQVVPIIQVLPQQISKIEAFSSHWNFKGNQLFLDFSLMDQFSLTDVSDLVQKLILNNVNIVLVLQENSDLGYLTLIQNLINNSKIKKVCIRISNNRGGFHNLDFIVQKLVNFLDVPVSQVSLLLDFEFISNANYSQVENSAIKIIGNIKNPHHYENIIIASSSFPDNLGGLQPAGKVYRLNRLEWKLWQKLQSQSEIKSSLKYSDYGTKHPVYSEVSFQGSCSIKYSVKNEYVIYRGELSSNHSDGNGQYITFAGQLILSTDYSGATFSWGDERIDFYASQLVHDPNRKTGNAGSWVEISQNHHITLITSIL